MGLGDGLGHRGAVFGLFQENDRIIATHVMALSAFATEAAASAGSTEEMKDTPGVSPGRLHFAFL